MFPNMQQYMRMKYGPKPPVEEVTEEEFVAAVIATGESEEKAKETAFFSKGLGAATDVGGRMLQVKQPPKPKKPRKIVKPGEAVDYQVEQQSTNHERICLGGEWMTFIVATQRIRQEKNLGVTEAMDYIDNLPWLE
jgi:hypothetical protein